MMNKKRPFYESPMCACARRLLLNCNVQTQVTQFWGKHRSTPKVKNTHHIFPYPFSSFSALTFANIRMRSPGGLQMWSRFPQQLSRCLIHFPPYHCGSLGQINDASRPLTSPGNPGVMNRGANINLQQEPITRSVQLPY